MNVGTLGRARDAWDHNESNVARDQDLNFCCLKAFVKNQIFFFINWQEVDIEHWPKSYSFTIDFSKERFNISYFEVRL